MQTISLFIYLTLYTNIYIFELRSLVYCILTHMTPKVLSRLFCLSVDSTLSLWILKTDQNKGKKRSVVPKLFIIKKSSAVQSYKINKATVSFFFSNTQAHFCKTTWQRKTNPFIRHKPSPNSCLRSCNRFHNQGRGVPQSRLQLWRRLRHRGRGRKQMLCYVVCVCMCVFCVLCVHPLL